MYEDAALEIWNLTDGGVALVAPQRVFPIVGKIKGADADVSMTYRLNGGPKRPVCVGDGSGGRLARRGDFAIDTIDRSEFCPGQNEIVFCVSRDSETHSSTVLFSPQSAAPSEPVFDLAKQGETMNVEEVGQVIDGRWGVTQTAEGPALQLAEGYDGYDRLILFGSDCWTSRYDVLTEFTIDSYSQAHNFHAFGPVFKWRPHEQGDGTHLPRTWTAGLGIYSTAASGLALRYGRFVTYGPSGKRNGNTLLASKRVSTARWLVSRAARRLPWVAPAPEFPAGQRWRMRLQVADGRHRLSVGPAAGSGRGPAATIEVEAPELIPSGAVGFLASYCAMTIHRFVVTPCSPAGMELASAQVVDEP
jgi:hypothetical protein